MADELQAIGQRLDQLLVEATGDGDGFKGAVRGHHAVQLAGAAFSYKLAPVLRLGCHQIGYVG